MKRALISDIHGNLEALRAVLDDIRQAGVTEVFCLGDVVGYGPNPRECIDLLCELPVSILGNHDQAAMFDPDGFNPVALKAIYWTRTELEDRRGNPAQNARRWDYLGEMPRMHNEEKLLFVHGSARDPTNEYVFPEDVYNQRKMENLFARYDQYCFQGHTHIPGVFTINHDFVSPEECDYTYELRGDKLMVNVGSVGQPRDGDPRACYVILHDEHLEFQRVEYDMETTIQKIYAIDGLDRMLGDRLREGR